MTIAADPTSGLRSVDDTLEAILGSVGGPLDTTETVSADRALGGILAEPAVAATDLPPWDNSAMDGYALRSADVTDALEDRPVRLRVIGEVAAGQAAKRAVEPGTAIRIATGAPLPPGADAVVPVEETTPIDESGAEGARGRVAGGPLPAACLVHVPVARGGSIRSRGSDLRRGDRLLEPGAAISPAAIALLAGAGIGHVRVHGRPRVAVLVTGDEVRAPGQPLGEAGIPDANGPGLRAMVAAAGGAPIDLGIARDDLEDVLGRLRRGIAAADAVIVAGGVSVGPYDVVKTAIEAVGSLDLWRVALQPGKPFAFGLATGPQSSRRVPIFGLPGNPVSVFVTFELFVKPVIARLGGRTDVSPAIDRAVLLDSARTSAGRRTFLRVRVERDDHGLPVRDERGRVKVRLGGGQGSHVLSALALADALAVVPESVETVAAGHEVELRWLDRW